jgi:hypothetical protein
MGIAFPTTLRQALLAASTALVLSGCSGPMVPPEDIDGATTVSAIEPVREPDNIAYAAPVDTASATENTDVLDTPNLAATDPQPLPDSNDQPLPGIDQDPAAQSQVPDMGINVDAELGAPVGLAEEQANDIAEEGTRQPVVAGIGTDELQQINPAAKSAEQGIDFGATETADEITLPTRRRVVEKETKVAFVPRFSNPLSVPETYGGLTAADRACRKDLVKLGVRFRELPPISDGASCGITHPIEVSGFAGRIQLKPAAKLNCNMTRVFAKWVKNELVPSARYRYFSGIKTIHQMSSYSCRKMNSRSSNPWSEHARGNALDIGKFVLSSGKEIDVRKKGFFAFREKGLLKAVRSDSCKYFNTVLGPGDAHHGDHFHFDLRSRKSGYRHCSL